MNLFLGFLVAAVFFFLLYLRWVSPVRLLRRLDAQPVAGGDGFRDVQQLSVRVRELAHRHRVPHPHLWILPEFSPNALVLSSRRGRLHLAVTEGLVRALSEEELDAAISICLAHGQHWGRTVQTWVSAAFFPLAAAVQRYPLPAQLLFSPVLAFLLRQLVRPSRFLGADQQAASYQSNWAVAATLQKLSVMGRKIPLRHWNLAMDSLYLVSPLALDDTPLWSPMSQPSVEKRRERLLAQSSSPSHGAPPPSQ